MCEYGSVGRRSKEHRTRCEQHKDRKERTPTYVCRAQYTRPAVSYEGQHRVETAVRVPRGEVSFVVAVGRIYTVSIRLKAWCRFILWSTTLQQLYTALAVQQQSKCLYDTEHKTDTGWDEQIIYLSKKCNSRLNRWLANWSQKLRAFNLACAGEQGSESGTCLY